jgi:hypothetical protein
MKTLNKNYVAPILVIVVGIGWLLNVQGIIPKVDWIWTIALAVTGVLVIAVGGLDKLTAVVGPFLVISSICAVLRQTGKLSIEREVPILTIILGILMLTVMMVKLPRPKALADNKD